MFILKSTLTVWNDITPKAQFISQKLEWKKEKIMDKNRNIMLEEYIECSLTNNSKVMNDVECLTAKDMFDSSPSLSFL